MKIISDSGCDNGKDMSATEKQLDYVSKHFKIINFILSNFIKTFIIKNVNLSERS